MTTDRKPPRPDLLLELRPLGQGPSTSLRIPDPIRAELVAAAEARGVSLSSLLRDSALLIARGGLVLSPRASAAVRALAEQTGGDPDAVLERVVWVGLDRERR